MNAAGIFTEPRSKPAQRFVQLANRREELRAEARQIQGQAAADDAQATTLAVEQRAAEARSKAFGEGQNEVKRVAGQLDKLQKAGAGRQQELRVVGDAIEAVEREVGRHAREHGAVLEAEVREDAAKAGARLQRVLRELSAAHDEYIQAGVRAENLLRIIAPERIRSERVPSLAPSLVSLAREAPGMAIAVPVPAVHGAAETVAPTAPASDEAPVTIEVVK